MRARAKFALAATGKAGTDYKEARQAGLAAIGVAASSLAGLLPDKEIARLPKARRGGMGPRVARSEHRFVRHLGKWACLRCGCTKKKTKSRQDRTSCPDRAKRHLLVHDTHRLFGGFYEQTVGIPNFTFCVICGCYSSQNSVGLKQVCKGTRASKVTIRARLANSTHPITKKPVRCIHRILLGIDTRKMAAKATEILGSSNLASGNEPPGSQETGAPQAIGQDGVAALPRENSFEESDDGWEEDDPFIAFAHG